MKRVVVMSDPHCGQEFGLTHPDFDSRPNDIDSIRYRAYRLRAKMWEWYRDKLAVLQPIHVLLDLGDNIDGKGEKSAGNELILPKLEDQCECASACILEAKAKRIFMVRGTPYHVGKDNCEDGIAKAVKAEKIGDHDYISVNGCVFDYAHAISRSETALTRERVTNLLWSEHDEFPKANVILRGHQHYSLFVGEAGNWLSMIAPGLQLSSKFGRTIAKRVIHFGLVWFDVQDDGQYSFNVEIKYLRRAKDELIVV